MKINMRAAFNTATVAVISMQSVLAQTPLSEQRSSPISMDRRGILAGKQYQADGLLVTATPSGARLNCIFQRLDGEATSDGLWLNSASKNTPAERFRVKAVSIGRDPRGTEAGLWFVSDVLNWTPQVLTSTGTIEVTNNCARFVRDRLLEEYSVSIDGVRQDFLILQRPVGDGELRIELEVSGAKAEPLVNGACLVLDVSGRKLAYHRLCVVDSKGNQLAARLEVTHSTRLTVVVDDATAIYPLQIDPTFSDADWVSMGGFPGADGSVNDMTFDDSGNLYIGGNFTVVGDVFASRVAKWDGSIWSALGAGVDGSVTALVISGTNLYVGGNFGNAGGNSTIGIAKWDGTQWSALGSGMNSSVYALAVSGTNLYAGGEFSTAGGVAAKGIAKWDGSNWSALGSGMGPDWANPRINALLISGTNLYVGGGFTTAGGQPADYVAKWDGNTWSALGSGLDGIVWALAADATNLYAGGWFTNAGGLPANRIAKWDGNVWSALGAGLGSSVYALAVAGTNLYVGGEFTTAGAGAANRMAKWDGTTWSSLGAGTVGTVSALKVLDGVLYAGGSFSSAGGSFAMHLARWNGNAWSALGVGGLSSQVFALAVSGGNLYVGGAFTIPGLASANRIAKWNGSEWSALGGGLNGSVRALAVSGGDVFVGGSFTIATNVGGIVAVNRIAKWNGTTWSALGLGLGLSGAPNQGGGVVNALVVSGPDLYVAGDFRFATNLGLNAIRVDHIAKWNGSTWSALGAGMSSSVFALALAGPNLLAGGDFNYVTNTGPIALNANGIASWNGSAWSALGAGLTGGKGAFALAVSGSDVYAGGLFTLAGGNPANYIAKWTGGNWLALGSGLNGVVNALSISGTNLYAAGSFTFAGAGPAMYVAKWDGINWSALGSGMNGSVNALTISEGLLYGGGAFTTAGAKVSAYVAKANISGLPLPGRFSKATFSPATGFRATFLDASIGQSYRIQTAPSLTGGSWVDYTNFTYAGSVVIHNASAGTGPNKFFRAVSP